MRQVSIQTSEDSALNSKQQTKWRQYYWIEIWPSLWQWYFWLWQIWQ